MEFYIAKRNPENDSRRYVFRVDAHTFAVVKSFGGELPYTVKIWRTEDSNLEKTMGYWNTTERFSPDPTEINAAVEKAMELTALVKGRET